MHGLQQHILREITLGGPRRFAQMKPKRVDGNQFVYHLRALARAGYVSPWQGKYILTPLGKRYAERVSLEGYQERIQPKIVTLLVLKNAKGEHLLYKRMRVPFRYLIGFPYGKIHLGERLEEAAQRELAEKTGLSAKLVMRGSVYLTVHDEEELLTHTLVHVFVGKNPKGTLREHMPSGDCLWAKAGEIPKEKLMPGVSQILKLLELGKKSFFAEYFLDVHEDPADLRGEQT